MDSVSGFRFANGVDSRTTFHFNDRLVPRREHIQAVFDCLSFYEEGSPELVSFEKCFISSERGCHALYDSYGYRIDKSMIHRKDINGNFTVVEALKKIEVSNVTHVISAPVFYGGVAIPHWGHFLIETAARVWPFVLDEKHRDAKLVFSPAFPFDHLTDNQIAIISPFCEMIVPSGQKGLTRIEKCYLPSPTFREGWEAYRIHGRLFKAVVHQLIQTKQMAINQTCKPLYISR